MTFESYEEKIRQMGVSSGAYRDLNLNYIKRDNKLYTAGDAFNKFCYGNSNLDNSPGAYSLGNLFSLTIAYLGSYLYKRGFTFDFVNSFQDEKAYLIERLQNDNILTVIIPTTLYVTSFPISEIIAFIRQYNTTARIIIGGPFVATQLRTIKEEILREYFFKSFEADIYINSSQGEYALAQTIYAIKNNLTLHGIDNIIFKDKDKYIMNSTSVEKNLLEENPIDWSLFQDRMSKFVAIRTSISCPFSCAFCGFPQHAGKYQTASIEHIERELNSLQKTGKVTSINIIDDTMNVPPERFKEMLRMIIRNKYDFNWNCNFRCQYADEEMVSLMKESRCQGALLGLESGSDAILKNMNKSVTADNYKYGLSLLHKYDIISYGSFIIGFPGETEKTVYDTVKFIEDYQPTFFRTQSWYCEPITPIYEQKEKYGISGSQFTWSHNTMNSLTAGNIVENLFVTINKSTWVPQYNFEFYSLFNLYNRGMNVNQLKRFFDAFNGGIKERLINPAQKEISQTIVNKFSGVFDENADQTDATGEIYTLNNSADNLSADFDF
jgi:radical SAM PhpK family P-methyltransferase